MIALRIAESAKLPPTLHEMLHAATNDGAKGTASVPIFGTTEGLFQRRSSGVLLRDRFDVRLPLTDKRNVRNGIAIETSTQSTIPWAMQMKAVSTEEPSRLVQCLTGAILGCGGWVLSRGANDTGMVNMLFEFERQSCVDIYSVLVAAGLDLGPSGHTRFTELCQCTRSQPRNCGTEIASIDLEVQTYPPERMTAAPNAGQV